MRLMLQLAASAVVVALGVTDAQAQGPGRSIGMTPPPGYSPYLNLLRPGTNPAINYYGLVRPQQAFAQSMQFLQGELMSQPTLADSQSGGPATTGHSIFFMNYGGYFMNTGAGQARSNLNGPARTPVATQPRPAPRR
jgi:hypothetical protein